MLGSPADIAAAALRSVKGPPAAKRQNRGCMDLSNARRSDAAGRFLIRTLLHSMMVMLERRRPPRH